jgi:hypothetical protein
VNTRAAFLVVVFAVAFAAAYTLAVWNNYALFTYHPLLGEIVWGVEKSRDGPAMYWYGWITTALLCALGACAVAALIPPRFVQRAWPGWAWLAPLCALLAFVWLLRNYFLR